MVAREVLIMAYKISSDCISCGACTAECPVTCITEGDGIFVIDESVCVDCGTCASVCPVEAPKQA
jgi:ferredoxin